MAARLIVTDMDNTLYSWVDYIVPAVEALVASVCNSTQLPRLKVVQSLKAVYEKYESNDYPFVLQESAIYAEFHEFGSFDKLVIQPARAAFAEARRRYLRPFPGVLETLASLRAMDIPVVGLTDAPRNPAEYRTKRLGFDQFFSALYTLPAFSFPRAPDGAELIAPDILRKDERGDYRPGCPVVELPRDFEKPNAEGLMRVCRDFGVPPEETVVVGDSVRKDIAVAKKVGAIDCWAEYGTYISTEYRERLDIISGRKVAQRHAASLFEGESSHRTANATHRLSCFSQLLEIVSESRHGTTA
jgi:phosphoglycolate phosphatase